MSVVRDRLFLVLFAVLVGSATALAPTDAAPAQAAGVGNDPFLPGVPYAGAFPDPTVLRVGTRYYAHATTVASLSLPAMSSSDLRTWTPRPALDPALPRYNEAMPERPAWARVLTSPGGRSFLPAWAPSVARTGPGQYVAAYAVPRASDGRRCVSIARGGHPLGPFTDRSTRPLVCGARGVIDPQIFRDRGRLWLLLKASGSPARLVVRRLNPSASAFATASRYHGLLTARLAWEGGVVENPAMIRFHKRLYLFYSANDYRTASYATGYARCRTVTGPCRREGRLLGNGPYLSGSGGATPFFDTAGRLRLAYHAWRTGNVGHATDDACLDTAAGCPQRRMYVAHLGAVVKGRLLVRTRR